MEELRNMEMEDEILEQARDQFLRPPLEDVCTIEVNIKDINDNAPIFDRANYDVPVAQDTPVDHRILRLSATDVDEGPNQQITYTLSSEKFPTDIEFFRW